jgi:hypothetical protein
VSTFLEASAQPSERHRVAVRGFGWAQEPDDVREYADALGWIRVLEAIGELIPRDSQAKRRVWGVELVADPVGRGQS